MINKEKKEQNKEKVDNLEKENQNIKIEELKIEKYPMAKSSHLIEFFLIMGYEESYIQEIIIKKIDTKIESEQNEKRNNKSNLDKNEKIDKETNLIHEFKCRHLPTIISSIGSNFPESIEDGNSMINKVFPIPPTIYYTSEDNIIYEPNSINVIFTNIQNEVVNIFYSYIFYEKEFAFNKSILFIPKAFVICSQYPFFNNFQKICKELLYKFKNDSLEIPLEIQLYNIVNFIPTPVNENLNITFFPRNDLNEIVKCESDKDLMNLTNQKVYRFKQLSGYRHSEIDFSTIFFVLPIDVIVQIYLHILTQKTIAFFSQNIEILNATIYTLQQFFYPLSPDEIVYSLSPIRYFCSEMNIQKIVGFLCSFSEVNNYNPFRNVKSNEFKCLSENEEIEGLDYDLFKCEFIVDLDKKEIIFNNNNNINNIENQEDDINDNSDIVNFIIDIFNKNENEECTELEISIIKLIRSLEQVKSKINDYETNEKLPNFFTNNTKYNEIIQEAFYKFNLEISYQYFQYISCYNGNYKIDKYELIQRKKSNNECSLNANDYLFLDLFSNTLFCNILINFVGGYSKNEPLLYKTPRLIFDNFISLKKMMNNMKIQSENLTKNFFDIIDNIYIDKDKEAKEKNITFLNFYKYYKNFISFQIYNLINNKYIDAKIDKTDENNFKYYYKYKRIDLDRNLLFEYIYIIEQMNIDEFKNIFNSNDDISFLVYKPIDQKITYRYIYNKFEEYFINSNFVDCKDIISISIINIVALSLHQKTVIHFILSVYALFSKLYFSVRKYVEIILSIANRLFINDKEENLFLYEIYFNLYKINIEGNNLFPNDQLIYLIKLKDILLSKIKSKKPFEDKFKKIEKLESDKLYSLESQKKYREILNILEEGNNIATGNIKNKIIFKSKYHAKKIITYNEIYSPVKIYKVSNKLLEIYYDNLDFNKINKYLYEKLLICLLFYSHFYENDLPKDINKFLFYCLIFDYL